MHRYLIQLDFFEIAIWALYSILGLSYIYVYKAFNTNKYTNYLIPGYLIKIFGALCFTLVYIYYYKEGDCNYYYYGTKELIDIFYQNPSHYFELMNLDQVSALEFVKKNHYSIFTLSNPESWFFSKTISPLCILSFNSYLGLTFLTSLISFIATYKLYILFNSILPDNEKKIFYIVFALPSVTFWGGGVMKDTITLFALYFIIFLFYNLIYNKKIFNLIPILFLSYIIINLKAYVIISMVPWIMVTLLFYFINLSKNPILKFIFVPYLMAILFGSMTIIVNNIMINTSKYQSEQIEGRIKGFHAYHTYLGGSSYDLGEIEFTTLGIISKIPLALNATFFRPYPWEAKNVMSLINSLESSFVLILTIFMFYKIGIINFFKIISKNSFLIGALIFILFFGFVIGFTSYNFGALSRFKIPLMAIYLFIILYALNIQKRINH